MQNRKHLLLIHGALGTKEQFSELSELLQESYQVHTFDLPGHGSLAFQRGQFSMYELANYVRGYIIANKLEKPLALGFSMGGYVALTLQSQSDIFSKIMTLGTKFDWNMATAEKEVKMLDQQKILEKVPQYADYLISLHAKENWQSLLEKHRNLMFDMAENSPLSNYALSRINIPTFITRGGNDKMVTKEESIETAYQIEFGEYYEFDNAEHPIEKMNKQILSEKIKEFLD